MIARASLRSVFEMRSDLISVWLMAVVLSALVLVCIHALQRAYAAAREPIIRLVDTKASPKLTLEGKQKWHLFLSHIWGTGQDQCATIKRQLLAYMPGLAVFLDVDDLHDISELEAYVEQTAVMLVFVSKGYFKSKNCLREIRHTIAMRKPLVLVHDPVVCNPGAGTRLCTRRTFMKTAHMHSRVTMRLGTPKGPGSSLSSWR